MGYVSIPHRHGTTSDYGKKSFYLNVSIPHRHGTTNINQDLDSQIDIV